MSRLSKLRTDSTALIRAIGLSALCAALILPLTGCGEGKVKPARENPIASQAKSGKQLLDAARAAVSPQRENLFLEAARVYVDNTRMSAAKSALDELIEDTLSDAQFVQFSQLHASIALHQDAALDAFTRLTHPRLEALLSADNGSATFTQVREQRATTFMQLGEYEAAVLERLALGRLNTRVATQKTFINTLWNNLLYMPTARLEYLSNNSPDATARGWYALALIGKNTQNDLTQQQAQINSWRRQWSDHPAAQNLPDDLQLVRELIASQPKHIALLLPQSGKLKEAGQALSDGFYSAYYLAHSSGRALPQVSLYDSNDAVNNYQAAVAAGADLVIGPLEKEQVTALAQLDTLPAPILALNYTDDTAAIHHKNFYQFGLAVEDEARQVARQGFADGHRQAMLIATNQEWSERASRAFADEWARLGGTVVSNTRFSPDENFSKLVKDAMLIEESLARAQKLQALLGLPVQSSARARADVDMVFLIANPVQARQIKPTFGFHFASNIPIYATSQVYSGEQNPKLDRDLNGVRFNTMPWLFDTSAERLTVKEHSASAAVYDRLQALGVDAFRVYARLPQLARVEQMRVFGATGTLRMLPDGRIEREQVWARFRNGIAQPQATVSTREAEPSNAVPGVIDTQTPISISTPATTPVTAPAPAPATTELPGALPQPAPESSDAISP